MRPPTLLKRTSSTSSSTTETSSLSAFSVSATAVLTVGLAHAPSCFSCSKQVHPVVYGEHGIVVYSVCLAVAAAVGVYGAVDIVLLL